MQGLEVLHMSVGEIPHIYIYMKKIKLYTFLTVNEENWKWVMGTYKSRSWR